MSATVNRDSQPKVFCFFSSEKKTFLPTPSHHPRALALRGGARE
jgi:hypothetical protein